jgi:hypothetical protein
MQPGRGLLDLSTDELKRLLGHLHQEELLCPVDAQRIAVTGFQYKSAELMAAFRGLDEAGVRAVLVCVLAERQHHMAEQE